MTSATLKDAPGCFGSPLLRGHRRCRGCAFRTACAARSRAARVELKVQMGVDVIDDQQALRRARRAGLFKKTGEKP